MKKSLALAVGLVWMFIFSSAYAKHITMPKLPIGEMVENTDRWMSSCGKTAIHIFRQWDIWTINNSWVLIVDKKNLKFWVISNLDGHPDGHYEDFMKLVAKHPNIHESICNLSNLLKEGE